MDRKRWGLVLNLCDSLSSYEHILSAILPAPVLSYRAHHLLNVLFQDITFPSVRQKKKT